MAIFPLHRRGFLATLGSALLARPASADQPEVDLLLVLAADCSGSVRAEHYRLQQQGYAAAFRDRRVINAIRSGLRGGIAATYFQWSGYYLQTHSIPWTLLRQPAEIERFAAALEAAPRTIFSGGTSPGGAIDYGRKLLGDAPATAPRRVIDVSGDGRSNNGRWPPAARDEAAAQGITINGLPILHLEPDIDDYYEKNVIGGPGAFMISARDYAAFADAVRRKLILEIAAR